LAKVLGGDGLRDSEGFVNLRDACGTVFEEFNDPQSVGMAECFEHLCNFGQEIHVKSGLIVCRGGLHN